MEETGNVLSSSDQYELKLVARAEDWLPAGQPRPRHLPHTTSARGNRLIFAIAVVLAGLERRPQVALNQVRQRKTNRYTSSEQGAGYILRRSSSCRPVRAD